MMIKRLSKICVIALASAVLFAAHSDADVVDAAADVAADAAADAVSDGEAAAAEAPAARTAAERRAEAEVRAMTQAASAAGAAASAAAAEREAAAAREAARISNVPAAVQFAEERSALPAKTYIVPSAEARTIGAAMAVARVGDTVVVRDGVYREKVYVAPGVVFRAQNQFKAILDGRGRNTVVTMGTGSVISGFEIRNGTVGVFSAANQAVIRQCRITKHSQSGIVGVGVLPVIEDNHIVFNRGSGIQGWDVRTTSGTINHNTIAFNANHGISLGGNSSIMVENNIIAFNDQFGVKPGDEAVRIELVNNNLYRNARMSTSLPTENISNDPLFINAKRMNFNLRGESRSVGQGTDNQNLGARISH